MRRLEQELAKQTQGLLALTPNQTPTLAAWLEQWLTSKVDLSPRTRERHAMDIRLYVAPHQERRRDEWEASLGEEWRGSGAWWDTPADTTDEVALVDEFSGDIFASRGTFTNFQRATARRRPTEMWQQEDVLQEGIERLLWVNPQNERDVEVLSRHFYAIERANFVPALEVKAMVEIFDDEDFLNAVGSDTGEAGYRLFDCLKDCYAALSGLDGGVVPSLQVASTEVDSFIAAGD